MQSHEIVRGHLSKMLGSDIADSIVNHLKTSSSIPKSILYFVFALTVKQIVVGVLSLLFASIGVPYIIMIVYSISNDLPVFEVFEMLENNSIAFALICVIFTVFIAIVNLAPGWAWTSDSSARDLSWFNAEEFGSEAYWTNLRWSISFLGGIVFIAVILLLAALFEEGEDRRSYIFASIGINIAVVLFVAASFLFFRYGIMKERGAKPGVGFLKYWEVTRKPSSFLMTNAISAVSFVFYIIILSKLFDKTNITGNLFQKNSLVYYIFLPFIITVISISMLIVTSMWVPRMKPQTPFIVIIFAVMFITCFQPGLPFLLTKYMVAMKLGGEISVTITVDANTAKNWPEIFRRKTEETSEKFVRSDPVLLVLLGKHKAFFKENVGSTPNSPRRTILLERSKIGEILF